MIIINELKVVGNMTKMEKELEEGGVNNTNST